MTTTKVINNEPIRIDLCKINNDAIDTHPFKGEYQSIMDKSNNKWFGLIFEMQNKLCINTASKKKY